MYKMIIERDIQPEVFEALRSYPVVVITGARQSGKTTLAQMVSNKPYFNLESLDIRNLVINDPRMFLNKIKETGCILDEFQRVPELASYLQELVDLKKENGFLILTGSNNFLLMENVSQSLAGRVAILKLMPFSLNELKNYNRNISTDELLFSGFYPIIYSENRNPAKAYDYYIQTYIERDIRQLINVRDLHLFHRFLQLCAGRTAQIVNFEQLANETGTSAKTIKSWISVLETSFIIYLLPPYFENINKRIVKSPKLYFNDVGLVSNLLGIENAEQIKSHPLRGQLFENMVVSEYIKHRYNSGLNFNLSYYRDNHGNEIDMIFKKGNTVFASEIKSSQTYHSSFSDKLSWFERIHKHTNFQKVLVYDGKEEWSSENHTIINYRNFISKLIELI